MSLDRLMRLALPLGLFVPVTPGTRHVTVGGAIAADIHGKNHHVRGSFAAARALAGSVAGDGSVRSIGPSPDPATDEDADSAEDTELFWATAGGMGLTGVILRATVAMLPVRTSRMLVDTERAADLDDLLDRLARTDDDYTYSVAWIDCVTRGRAMGRSVLTRGWHAEPEHLSAKQRRDPLRFAPSPLLTAPPVFPSGLLNRATVAAFNELWFRKAPVEKRGQVQEIGSFFHPLDGVSQWNRIYGPRGFRAIPVRRPVRRGGDHARRAGAHRRLGQRVVSGRAQAVRAGQPRAAVLSQPRMDVGAGHPGGRRRPGHPARRARRAGRGRRGAGLSRQGLAAAPARLLAAMYPRLDSWRATRRRIDPDRTFTSDLARRLDL